jgi:hypothetical protein
MGSWYWALHIVWCFGRIVSGSSSVISSHCQSNITISSGWLLWNVFLGVDSYQFPAKNYGDLAFRSWGRPLRHIVNFLQALQLLISVGVIVISNGQALSQMTKFKLCYAVCCLLWALAGFAVGQVRTLQKFGILANAAVFINLMIMFISMGVFAHSPPNYAISVLGSAGGVVDPTTITPSNATGTLVYVRVDFFLIVTISLGFPTL